MNSDLWKKCTKVSLKNTQFSLIHTLTIFLMPDEWICSHTHNSPTPAGWFIIQFISDTKWIYHRPHQVAPYSRSDAGHKQWVPRLGPLTSFLAKIRGSHRLLHGLSNLLKQHMQLRKTVDLLLLIYYRGYFNGYKWLGEKRHRGWDLVESRAKELLSYRVGEHQPPSL